jgi:tetratricopeptide (TPR) repeat protein
MKQLTILVASVLLFACNRSIAPSATAYTNTEIKNANNQNMLAGHCNIHSMQQGNYKDWYEKSYSSYTVDSATATILAPQLKNKTIEIFLGTWCGDSKREVPRMLKVLQTAQVDTANIKLIFVDNADATYKQSPQHEEAGKFIHHVPTFIVYDGNKEISRIVESPVVSLEKDLLAITTKQAYIPNYKAALYWQQKVKHTNKKMSDEQLATLATTIKPLCKHSGELNAVGYILMAQKKYTQAINILKLNTFLYPTTANTFDSLGEAYLKKGNKDEAITCYQKVLALDAKNENAKKMLEQLK